MAHYQIIYNASQKGWRGTNGFAVRTVTPGIPAEYIDLVEKDDSLRKYESGRFRLSNESGEIFADPKRILDFPVSYFHRRIKTLSGKSLSVLGRIVNACYDYPFYKTGSMTRPGNHIAHLFLFEEAPDKAAFDMLLEENLPSAFRFLPVDRIPRADNAEMRSLMIGEPSPIETEGRTFIPGSSALSEETLALLFAYREAIKVRKPLFVQTDSARTGRLLAGLMQLLPPEQAAAATFRTNYHSNLPSGARIFLINEYYDGPIAPTGLFLLDKADPTPLEKLFRSDLEKALKAGDSALAASYVRWIFSDVAYDLAGQSREINDAMFRYVVYPERFLREDLSREGLLPVLKAYLAEHPEASECLLAILSESFTRSTTPETLAEAISLNEKVRLAGIAVEKVMPVAQTVATPCLIASVAQMANSLTRHGEDIISRYTNPAKWPSFETVLGELQTIPSEEDRFRLLKMIESDPDKRMEKYAVSLSSDPSRYASYYHFLAHKDKEAAARFDWVGRMRFHWDNPDFAPYFFNQLIARREGDPFELFQLYADIASRNNQFKEMVIRQAASIFRPDRFASALSEDRFEAGARLIEESVFPFFPAGSEGEVKWKMMHRVLLAETPEEGQVEKYYQTALSIHALKALHKVVPLCLKHFSLSDEETMKRFVDVLFRLYTEEQSLSLIKDYVSRDESKIQYVILLLQHRKISGYSEILLAAEKAGIPNKAEEIAREEYRSLLFKDKIGRLFSFGKADKQ